MKLSPQWVRDFVDLAVDDRRLAEDLTNVGISVEGISGSGGDTVFEMELGTNRPDAMNHYGVAREAAAIYDLPLRELSAVSDKSPLLAKDARNGAPKASDDPIFPITVEEPALWIVALPSRRLARGRVARARPGPRWPRDSRQDAGATFQGLLGVGVVVDVAGAFERDWSCESAPLLGSAEFLREDRASVPTAAAQLGGHRPEECC
jgi:hypothetical protein